MPTVAQYSTSQPVAVSAGSIVTVTPSAGATAVVEYTLGSFADIGNGVAVWKPWAKGSIASAASDLLNDSVFMRVSAQGGSVSFSVNANPSAVDIEPFRTDWGAAYNPAAVAKKYSQARVWSGVPAYQTGFAGYTWAQTLALPSDFAAIRLGFACLAEGSYTIDACAAAAVSALNDTFGTGQTFTPITSGNGSTSLVVPARSGPNQQVVFTDWVPLDSVARSDGGQNPLVTLRAYVSGAFLCCANHQQTLSGTSGWGIESGSAGLPVRTGFKAGDFVSSNTAGFTAPTQPSTSPFMFVQYLSKTKGITIGYIGDSITRGEKTSIVGLSWGVLASAQLQGTLGFPVSSINYGTSGQSSPAYLAKFIDMIKNVKPEIAVFSGYTRNAMDTTTIQIARCRLFLNICAENGILPAITTGTPDQLNTSLDPTRISTNAAIRQLCATYGATLIDMDAATSAGGSPAVWQAGYADADGVHPNDVGNAAMRDAAINALLPTVQKFVV